MIELFFNMFSRWIDFQVHRVDDLQTIRVFVTVMLFNWNLIHYYKYLLFIKINKLTEVWMFDM